MAAIKLRWPTALVQFEDFQSKHAIKLLMRYKKEYLMFNDDIQVRIASSETKNTSLQGTAATVLAGLYGAMKVRGLSPADLKDQVFVVAGAGSAGSGVMLTIRNAIIRRHGLTKEEANRRFYIIDQDGLITKGRKNLAEMEDLFYDLSSFAVDDTSLEGMSLIDTINMVKPNVLIGLSAVGGLFNKEVLTAMNQNESPPIIFPLSNPTSRSECNAKQILNLKSQILNQGQSALPSKPKRPLGAAVSSPAAPASTMSRSTGKLSPRPSATTGRKQKLWENASWGLVDHFPCMVPSIPH